MMEKVVLTATRRPVTGKKVGALRRSGQLPAIMYGHKFESTPILIDLREATQKLTGLSASQIVYLVLDGQEHAALVREKQRYAVKNLLLHVDFQVVSMTEKIRTEVPIVLHGVSPAVKDYNGVIVTSLSSVMVEALPSDLPEHIVVDLTTLNMIGDSVLVRDLAIPEKVTVLTHSDEVVVNVTGTAPEEVPGEEGGPAEPEVIERGKKEEEE